MSGITKLEDQMIAAHVSPHEVLEIKQTVNQIIDAIDEIKEELYRIGPNSKQ